MRTVGVSCSERKVRWSEALAEVYFEKAERRKDEVRYPTPSAKTTSRYLLNTVKLTKQISFLPNFANQRTVCEIERRRRARLREKKQQTCFFVLLLS